MKALSPELTPRIYRDAAQEPVNARKFLDGFKAAAYHADKEAISQGSHQHILASPAHFVDEWTKTSFKDTPLMRNGTLVHCGLFEPEVYKRYIIKPDFGNANSNAAKEAKAKWLAEIGDTPVADEDEKKLADEMVDAIGSHPKWSELTRGMAFEQTVYWSHERTKVWSRARLDGVNRQRRVVLDLKNTLDASPRAFGRHIEEFGYHYQAAHYLDAANAVNIADGFGAPSQAFEKYIFCVCERTGHHAVKFYELRDRALARGQALRENAYDILAKCIETNNWPSYEAAIETIDLPPWSYASTIGDF